MLVEVPRRTPASFPREPAASPLFEHTMVFRKHRECAITGIETPFTRAVHRAVRRIPAGKVLSYGDVAVLAGRPGAARGVGSVLRELPEGSDVPWWRVVASSGDISLPHMAGQLQRMLLRQEGVTFRSGGRIDMKRYRWQPEEGGLLGGDVEDPGDVDAAT